LLKTGSIYNELNMIRRLPFIIIALSLFVSTAFANGSSGTLRSLVERALDTNPEILAAKEEIGASRARIPQAGAWDDPRFTFKTSNIPIQNLSFRRTPMSGKDVGISQRVPLSGHKGSSKKIAKFEADSAKEKARDTIAQVVWLIKDRYYELAYVNSALGVTQRNLRVAKGLVDIANRRLESDEDAPEQEVFQAQVERFGYSKYLHDLKRRRDALSAELAALVADGGSVPSPGYKSLHTKRAHLNKSHVLDYSREDHPKIKRRLALLNAAKRRVTWSKQKVFPDIDLSFSYRIRENSVGDPVRGEDFFTVGASLPLPIFMSRKQLKKVAESKSLYRKSQNELEGMKQKITYEVEDAWAEYEWARSDIRLLAGRLIPNAQASLDTSVAAYEVGKIEFYNALSSQLGLYKYEIDLARSRADYLQAMAKLDYLVWGMNEDLDL
jgi:outer membrane protein TolC